MTPQIQLVLVIVATAIATLFAKIMFDWLRPRKQEVPRAQNGFITQAFLEDHCGRQEAACVKLFAAEVKALRAEMKGELSTGNQRFGMIEKSLEGLHKKIDGKQHGSLG